MNHAPDPTRLQVAGPTRWKSLLIVWISLHSATTAFGQPSPAKPQELIRQAVESELASPFITQNCSYEYHRTVADTEQTLLMVKTNDLVVGKAIRIGGAPVPAHQEEQEDRRLRQLLANPREQEAQRKQQLRLEDHLRAVVEAIPVALEFTQTGNEIGPNGHNLVHFSFKPKSNFHPDRAELDFLLGLAGTIIIDETTKRIVKLDAELFRNIDFGWGILIHMNKGSTLFFDRELEGKEPTNIREFSLNVNGRVLVLKTFEIRWRFDHFTCFRQPVALASAIAMLTSPSNAFAVSQ